MTGTVTPTQADRDAAWIFADFGHLPDSQERERWIYGYYDEQPVGHPIKAFARHRLEAEATQAAEIAKLRADNLDVHSANERLSSACWAKDQEIARLREALEPFAKAAEIRLCGGDYWTGDKTIQGTDIAFHITFGDLRRAAALSAQPSEQEGGE